MFKELVQLNFMNNRNEAYIVETALHNLAATAGIAGTWKGVPAGKEVDGVVGLTVNGQKLTLNADVKTELRMHQLPRVLGLAQTHKPLLVVATHLFPKVKERLREAGIGYLEAAGNLFVQQAGTFVWLEAQKAAVPQRMEKGNRAFTKTGARLVFHFLLNEGLLSRPYREMAQTAGIALGNVKEIIDGLYKEGFLIKLDKARFALHNKKALFEKWIRVYAERLQPALLLGHFRFLQPEDFNGWRRLPLHKDKTWWGGEPAGDLYTNWLNPGELTLYTLETKTEMIKGYRIIPDPKGNLRVFKKFWQGSDGDIKAPALLTYADLVNTGDPRCLETAQKLYDAHLQNSF